MKPLSSKWLRPKVWEQPISNPSLNASCTTSKIDPQSNHFSHLQSPSVAVIQPPSAHSLPVIPLLPTPNSSAFSPPPGCTRLAPDSWPLSLPSPLLVTSLSYVTRVLAHMSPPDTLSDGCSQLQSPFPSILSLHLLCCSWTAGGKCESRGTSWGATTTA